MKSKAEIEAMITRLEAFINDYLGNDASREGSPIHMWLEGKLAGYNEVVGTENTNEKPS